MVATGWVSCLSVSLFCSIEGLVLPIGVIVEGGGDCDLIRILFCVLTLLDVLQTPNPAELS